MARKPARKPARSSKTSKAAKAKAGPAKKSRSRYAPKRPKQAKSGRSDRKQARREEMGAAEALAAFLESPLVTDVIAAGATAGLGAMTQHALSKKEGGAKRALKEGAKAAAAAMGTRLVTEIDEILKSLKEARREGK